MKTAMVIICVVVTFVLAGVLYGTQGQNEEEEKMTLAQTYTHQYPAEMPEVVLHPMTAAPLF